MPRAREALDAARREVLRPAGHHAGGQRRRPRDQQPPDRHRGLPRAAAAARGRATAGGALDRPGPRGSSTRIRGDHRPDDADHPGRVGQLDAGHSRDARHPRSSEIIGPLLPDPQEVVDGAAARRRHRPRSRWSSSHPRHHQRRGRPRPLHRRRRPLARLDPARQKSRREPAAEGRCPPSTSARRSSAGKTRGSCAARAASSTTSRCPACCTRPSSARRTPTPASRPSAPTPRRPCPASPRVFTFADLERWMKPLPALRRRAARPGRRRPLRHAPGRAVRALPRPRALRGRDRRHGRRRQPRTAPRTPPSAIEVEWEPLPAVVDMVAAAEPGGAARPRRLGHQRGRRLHPRHRRRRRAPSPAADVVMQRDLPHPALRRHAARGARRGGAVGPARRHAHHLEQHPGLALRRSRAWPPRSSCRRTRSA